MTDLALDQRIAQAKAALDAHVVESVQWHFNPETGCDYWLNKAKKLDFDPQKEIKCFDDFHAKYGKFIAAATDKK